jgi:hypothetical protein
MMYKTVILPAVVLYDCENRSFTAWEKSKLRVFENGVGQREESSGRMEKTA